MEEEKNNNAQESEYREMNEIWKLAQTVLPVFDEGVHSSLRSLRFLLGVNGTEWVH